jgi:hypothetical protein
VRDGPWGLGMHSICVREADMCSRKGFDKLSQIVHAITASRRTSVRDTPQQRRLPYFF